jgi:hypothetical protein
VTITGYRWATLERWAWPHHTVADQFVSLLVPDSIAAGKDPSRTGVVVIAATVNDRSVAIGGDCYSPTLALERSDRAASHQFVALLAPDSVGPREDPHSPGK